MALHQDWTKILIVSIRAAFHLGRLSHLEMQHARARWKFNWRCSTQNLLACCVVFASHDLPWCSSVSISSMLLQCVCVLLSAAQICVCSSVSFTIGGSFTECRSLLRVQISSPIPRDSCFQKAPKRRHNNKELFRGPGGWWLSQLIIDFPHKMSNR